MPDDEAVPVALPGGEVWGGPWRSVPVAEFAATLRDRHTGDGRPTVVAVDGRSAGGKSTLAARLAGAVPGAALVHTDDVAWWHSFFDWVDLMRTGVLEPLHRGEAVAFTPPAWTERGRAGAIVVPPSARLVVVEGVGAGRRELADLVDATVWVQSDEATREAREAARVAAGEVTARLVDEWQREELPFLAAQRVWERADCVVAGTTGALTAGVLPRDPADDVLVGRVRPEVRPPTAAG
jgi:uridine kinase